MTRNEHGQMFVILISELHTNSKIIHIPDSLISDICDPITTTKTPNRKEFVSMKQTIKNVTWQRLNSKVI